MSDILDELEKAHQATDSKDWRVSTNDNESLSINSHETPDAFGYVIADLPAANCLDAAFIVAAHRLVPALIAEVRGAEAKLKMATETLAAVEARPAKPTIVIEKIARRASKIGFGGTKEHCGYWLDVKIDDWLVVRSHIKRDVFDYLKDRGIEVAYEGTEASK